MAPKGRITKKEIVNRLNPVHVLISVIPNAVAIEVARPAAAISNE